MVETLTSVAYHDFDVLSLRQAAELYASLGFRVFPCGHRAKEPAVKGGVHAATNDVEQVRRIWRERPGANIGLSLDGLVLVDLDPRNDGPSREELWERTGGWPQTAEAISGSGGRHIFFRARPGWKPRASLGPGIDCKSGAGSYALVAPSIHPDGGVYRWDGADPIADLRNIAEAPDWVYEGARREQPKSEQQTGPGSADGSEIERAAAILAAAWPPEGSRNRCFLALAGACARAGIAQQVAEELARRTYRKLWPADPDYAQAAREVAASYVKFAAGEETTGYATLRDLVGEDAAAEAMRVLGAKPRLHVIHGGREGEPDLLTQRPTDAGNAERLFALHGEDYLYVGDWGCFVVWDGARWIEDKRNLMLDRVRDTARALYRQAARLEGDRRVEFAKLSARLESQSGAAGALKFAAAIQDSVVLSSDFDTDPFLLNCLNGTIDLRTGELRPHDRKDRMLKLAPVEYDPGATCPRWEQFLHEVFEPHPDVLPWIQKAVGYSLTASVREQVFFLCWGRGCNGKGTLLNTIAEMLGDYALAMDIRALADAQGRPDSPSEHIAGLHGARFAKAEEPSDNFVMNENLIKWLTGDDLLLYQNSFGFHPTHKIWIVSNPKPVIRGTDIAIWRRVRFIPFEACFVGREDKALREKLRAEMPGILRWAVAGAVRWYREGLGDCDTVVEATQAYRDECDQVSRFVTECCYVGPTAYAKARPLYQAYRDWATSCGEHPMSDKKFSARMMDRGFQKKHTETGTVYLGVGLFTGGEGVA
jgi:P4 family phage/plasmid primase-like protien